jgi:ribosomal protein L21E
MLYWLPVLYLDPVFKFPETTEKPGCFLGRRISMENRNKQDGIRSWCRFVQQYETDGNRNVRIKRLESVINTVFHRNYRGRLVDWIQDYEDAFTVHRTGFTWAKDLE